MERTERRIKLAGGLELAVDLLPGGREPGFLFVHGLASNARLWDGVARFVALAGHASCAVDLRGHGRSDKPEDGYDYDTLTADLVAVMRAFSEETGVLGTVAVGQSFGGNLVLELAARRPAGLVGVACVDGGMFDLRARFETWEEVRQVLAPPKLAGTPAARLEAGMRAAHRDWPEEGIAGSMANFAVLEDGTVSPLLTLDRHMSILRTMWNSRPRDIYPRVEVPVLFLPADSPSSGAERSAEKRAGVEAAVAALSDASVRWFSPADHDVHAQFPEAVAEALLERFA